MTKVVQKYVLLARTEFLKAGMAFQRAEEMIYADPWGVTKKIKKYGTE